MASLGRTCYKSWGDNYFSLPGFNGDEGFCVWNDLGQTHCGAVSDPTVDILHTGEKFRVCCCGGSTVCPTDGQDDSTQATTTTTTTPWAMLVGPCSQAYGQCGGQGYTGPTCCPAGWRCNFHNVHYSQCNPDGSVGDCSRLWEQCGGKTFNGPTCCQAGSVCDYSDEWYSQCKPGEAPAQTTTAPPSATASLLLSAPAQTTTAPPSATASPLPSVSLVIFKDTNAAEYTLSGSVQWSPPAEAATLISGYEAFMAYDAYGSFEEPLWYADPSQIAGTLLPVGTNDFRLFEPTFRSTTSPNEYPANWLIVYTVSHGGVRQATSDAAKIPLYDNSTNTPFYNRLPSVVFNDLDPAPERIAGQVQWVLASREDTAFLHTYKLGLVSDSGDSLHLMSVPVGTNEVTIPTGTACWDKQWLMVYPCNDNGCASQADAASVQLKGCDVPEETVALATTTMAPSTTWTSTRTATTTMAPSTTWTSTSTVVGLYVVASHQAFGHVSGQAFYDEAAARARFAELHSGGWAAALFGPLGQELDYYGIRGQAEEDMRRWWADNRPSGFQTTTTTSETRTATPTTTSTQTTTTSETGTTTPMAYSQVATLFTADGDDKKYKNKWEGWYKAGDTVTSGDGKRVSYDLLPLSALRFTDASGTMAEYTLDDMYLGLTLLDIVQICMGTEPPRNENTAAWLSGHCFLGTLTRSSGSRVLSMTLRVGVGDGQGNNNDWALFALEDGNGDGNFFGSNAYAFGSEKETNSGYRGVVTITGLSSLSALERQTEVLFQAKGKEEEFKNDWDGWFTEGNTVTTGKGKRPAYDSLPLRLLSFSDDSGTRADYALDAAYVGMSLLDIVRTCMGSARANANDNSQQWRDGHCSPGTLVQSAGSHGLSTTLRLGVGDGTADSDDWALFVLEDGNAGADFARKGTYAIGSKKHTNAGHDGLLTIMGLKALKTTTTTTSAVTKTTTTAAAHTAETIRTATTFTATTTTTTPTKITTVAITTTMAVPTMTTTTAPTATAFTTMAAAAAPTVTAFTTIMATTTAPTTTAFTTIMATTTAPRITTTEPVTTVSTTTQVGGAYYAVVWHQADGQVSGQVFSNEAAARELFAELFGGGSAAAIFGPQGQELDYYGSRGSTEEEMRRWWADHNPSGSEATTTGWWDSGTTARPTTTPTWDAVLASLLSGSMDVNAGGNPEQAVTAMMQALQGALQHADLQDTGRVELLASAVAAVAGTSASAAPGALVQVVGAMGDLIAEALRAGGGVVPPSTALSLLDSLGAVSLSILTVPQKLPATDAPQIVATVYDSALSLIASLLLQLRVGDVATYIHNGMRTTLAKEVLQRLSEGRCVFPGFCTAGSSARRLLTLGGSGGSRVRADDCIVSIVQIEWLSGNVFRLASSQGVPLDPAASTAKTIEVTSCPGNSTDSVLPLTMSVQNPSRRTPPPAGFDYACVWYNQSNGAWSTDGVSMNGTWLGNPSLAECTSPFASATYSVTLVPIRPLARGPEGVGGGDTADWDVPEELIVVGSASLIGGFAVLTFLVFCKHRCRTPKSGQVRLKLAEGNAKQEVSWHVVTPTDGVTEDGKVHIVWDLDKCIDDLFAHHALKKGASEDGLSMDETTTLPKSATADLTNVSSDLHSSEVIADSNSEEPPRRESPAYEEGEQVEYYSLSHHVWVSGHIQLSVIQGSGRDASSSGTVDYAYNVRLARDQLRLNVPLHMLRPALGSWELVEVRNFLEDAGSVWEPAMVHGAQNFSCTTLGYTVSMAPPEAAPQADEFNDSVAAEAGEDNAQTRAYSQDLRKVPAARIRRRFYPGNKVEVYRGASRGWVKAEVVEVMPGNWVPNGHGCTPVDEGPEAGEDGKQAYIAVPASLRKLLEAREAAREALEDAKKELAETDQDIGTMQSRDKTARLSPDWRSHQEEVMLARYDQDMVRKKAALRELADKLARAEQKALKHEQQMIHLADMWSILSVRERRADGNCQVPLYLLRRPRDERRPDVVSV